VALEKIKDYARGPDITLQLKTYFYLIENKRRGKGLLRSRESLVNVLTAMEFEGIKVDMDFLREYSKELEKDARSAEENVYQQAGVKFNLLHPNN